MPRPSRGDTLAVADRVEVAKWSGFRLGSPCRSRPGIGGEPQARRCPGRSERADRDASGERSSSLTSRARADPRAAAPRIAFARVHVPVRVKLVQLTCLRHVKSARFTRAPLVGPLVLSLRRFAAQWRPGPQAERGRAAPSPQAACGSMRSGGPEVRMRLRSTSRKRPARALNGSYSAKYSWIWGTVAR